VVAVPLVAYPLLAFADGSPRFPSPVECVHPAVEGEPADVVFGRYDDPVTADSVREKVVSVGFVGTESLGDGCGRWKVVLEDVPTVDIAREVQAEAATVELATTLERSSDG
jgi:hypothetical protein